MRIIDIRDQDRPYERLGYEGIKALRDTELLAILLQSGNKKMSSIQLAEELLYKCAGGNLYKLSKMTVHELQEVNGVGIAKSSRVVAAFELGRRMNSVDNLNKIKFNCPSVIYEYSKKELGDIENERVLALLLDVQLKLIQKLLVDEGVVSSVKLSVRELCKLALKSNASNVILLHNHPSGDPSPSPQDYIATRRIVQSLAEVGIKLVDHIVVSRTGYKSIASLKPELFDTYLDLS